MTVTSLPTSLSRSSAPFEEGVSVRFTSLPATSMVMDLDSLFTALSLPVSVLVLPQPAKEVPSERLRAARMVRMCFMVFWYCILTDCQRGRPHLLGQIAKRKHTHGQDYFVELQKN